MTGRYGSNCSKHAVGGRPHYTTFRSFAKMVHDTVRRHQALSIALVVSILKNYCGNDFCYLILIILAGMIIHKKRRKRQAGKDYYFFNILR